jgi:hypothetical protein
LTIKEKKIKLFRVLPPRKFNLRLLENKSAVHNGHLRNVFKLNVKAYQLTNIVTSINALNVFSSVSKTNSRDTAKKA